MLLKASTAKIKALPNNKIATALHVQLRPKLLYREHLDYATLSAMLSLYFLNTICMTLSHRFPYFPLTLRRLHAPHEHEWWYTKWTAGGNASEVFLPPPKTRGVGRS